MVQHCPHCGSTNVHREEQLNNWFCSECGDSFEVQEDKANDNPIASAPAPSRPPYPAPEVMDGEVHDVNHDGGEIYVAIYEVAGRMLVGSSVFDNVEQVRAAFESINPTRLFAVRVRLPEAK